ncbi:hypothetical protein GCM10010289_85280 [Streptomyces violascens]|uniref:Uncharacterized protein n=1 Tax=Streptomyces violascens TaxID=67381 RepID=A0ABQ3QSU1_9ACTN|nr:hypothetical protein GCM10010289_85280 [Streptomyces violascens]GHI40340.1 hypothetical protein Sviol_47480 [Streptomyces violascens]
MAAHMSLPPRRDTDTLRYAITAAGAEQRIDEAPLPKDRWVHVAVTYGAGTAVLYATTRRPDATRRSPWNHTTSETTSPPPRCR